MPRKQRPKKPLTSLLALDASSTAIGWSLWDLRTPPYVPVAGGTLHLGGSELAARLSAAYHATGIIVDRLTLTPDVLAIEYGAFASTKRDEQQQALGVIRMVLYQRLGITTKSTIKVPPNSAKKAIAGYGLATKEQVALFAQAYIAEADEHAHDSIGIALGALERLGLLVPGAGVPTL